MGRGHETASPSVTTVSRETAFAETALKTEKRSIDSAGPEDNPKSHRWPPAGHDWRVRGIKHTGKRLRLELSVFTILRRFARANTDERWWRVVVERCAGRT